jgi:hypothetical protein
VPSARAPGEVVAGDVLCVACDPGLSTPTQPVAEPSAAAGRQDYPAAGGMFWFSRKRFSGS